MREIQDLTLQRAAHSVEVDSTFAERRERYRVWLQQEWGRQGHRELTGIRVTMLPVAQPLYLDRVFRNPDVEPSYSTFRFTTGPTTRPLHLPPVSFTERPIVRGLRRENRDTELQVVQEVTCAGRCEMTITNIVEQREDGIIAPEWVFGATANMLATARAFRQAAGAPAAEYGLEVELVSYGGRLRLGKLGSSRGALTAGLTPDENPLVLPRVSFGPDESATAVITTLWRDYFHASGVDVGDQSITIELPWLAQCEA